MLPRLGIRTIGHQRESAIVAAKADAHQSLVFHPRAQTQRTEIPQVDAALGKRRVKLRHQGLIFGTNRTDRHRRAVFQFPLPHILRRIRTDARTGQLAGLHRGIMHHHSRIQCEQMLRRRQQRINVDFLDPRLLHHELAEAHQQAFQSGQVDRLAPAHTQQG